MNIVSEVGVKSSLRCFSYLLVVCLCVCSMTGGILVSVLYDYRTDCLRSVCVVMGVV